MNNRAIKKLLSVVLVMAICVSTVCGCLITANAADTDATYTVTAESLHAYADEGKATITFNLDSGFTGGSFTLLKNNATFYTNYDEDGNLILPSPWNSEYKDVEISVVGGTKADGTVMKAEEMNITIFNDTNNNGTNDAEEEGDVTSSNNALWYDAEGSYKDAEGNNYAYDPTAGTVNRWTEYKLSDISFNSGDIAYKSITFEFTFEWDYCMQPNSKNDIIFAKTGQSNYDGKAYSDPVLTNGGTSYLLSENVVEGNINYFHSHCSSPIDKSTQLVQKNDYGIYTGKCRYCGAVTTQLLSDELASTQPNAYYDISAMNIVYEDNGSVSLNIHCAGFTGSKEKLIISYIDGTKTIYGDNKTSEIAGSTSFNVSPYAKEKVTNENGSFYYKDNVLPNDTYMYEIKGLSAKDIGSKFYLTRVVEGSGDYAGKLFCGNTQEVSLDDYCVDVVDGNKVYYPAGTTEAQIKADKAVAVAFINYGVAAANALNHKVSYEEEEITVTDTWTGDKTMPTKIDEAGNIIINTAEELAWVALVGGDSTIGTTYKIADNQVFDMQGMQGITLDSTTAQVKKATQNTANYWSNDSAVFKGTFNGNGAIVYNICGKPSAAFGGLFPTIAANATIKNVTVKASAFYGYHNAGGILGYGNGQYTIDISNCAVENCFISDNGSTKTNCRRIAAVFVGGSQNCSTNVSNCFAAGNICSAYNIEGGIIGNGSAYAPTPIVMSNNIVIGSSPYPVVVGSATLGADVTTRATYSNIYTDQTVSQTGITTLDVANMKGSAAATNMPALDWGNIWATTDSYPGLNPDVYCTDVWDGTKVEPTATDSEGNVIISTAEELAWVALSGGSSTTGVNYKVADGIKYFNMNGSVGIAADSALAEVKAATATTNLWNHSADFLGTFDGNGVVIYNVRNATGAAYGGLFPRISGVNSSIKNVTVKASVFYAYHGAGAILGQGSGQYTTTIDNCAVENCYMTDNNNTNTNAQRSAGIFVGCSANHCININNCFAADNECSGVNSYGGFVGRASAWAPGAFTFTNSISLGVSPYTTAGAGAIGDDIAVKATWTNVYTDTDLPSGASTNAVNGIQKLTTAQMTGENAVSNMPALGWGYEWFEGATGEYPLIDGEAYADVWDGTKVGPTATDSEGNIIISTAEELAWVILQGGTATQDKNYKVADGIKYFNMDGMTGITLNSTAAEVQSATKNTAKLWVNGSNYFMGNFDGNGVTVYNVNGKGDSSYGWAGLFPVAKQTADGDGITIKNIKVCASYFTAYHGVGAVIGFINAPGTSCTATLEKLSAENCYISDNGNTNANCQRTVSNIVGLVNHTKLTMSNCFAADNTLSAINIVGGLVGNTSAYSKGVAISNSIVIGTSPIPVELLTTDEHGLQSAMSNATYTDVYTDQETSQAGVTTIDTADAKGAGADAAMPNLDWDTVWFTGAPGEYPCFVDDGVEYVSDKIEALLVANGYYSDFIANFYKTYSRDSFETNNENCNFYATGLTLKTNPYMTVTFAFHDTYRTNHNKVEAVFEVGDKTISVMGDEMVNNPNAGRYHMVRLKDIPVMNLCDDITVTLNYDGSQVGTGKISAAGFAFAAVDAGEGFEYYETAAQALVFYAEALQNRYATRVAQ